MWTLVVIYVALLSSHRPGELVVEGFDSKRLCEQAKETVKKNTLDVEFRFIGCLKLHQ